jgi:translation initiation factor 1A
LEIQCLDGVKRAGHIRGKMKKKVWIAMGDLVLVALREYENDKCDIIGKYTEDEVRKLKQMGEIPESIKLPESENKKDDDYGDIVFEQGGDSDEDNVAPQKRRQNKKQVSDSDEEDEISEEEKEIDIDNI